VTNEENNCSMDNNCSSGTCAPVSPFSKEGILFLIFILILLAILFLALFFNGYI